MRSIRLPSLRSFVGWTACLLAVMAVPSIGRSAEPPASAPSDRQQRLAGRASARQDAAAAELFRSADTTYMVGELSRAAELYRQILQVAPQSAFIVRAAARLGDCAYEQKAYDDAARLYRTAAAMASDQDEERSAAIRAEYMAGQSSLAGKQYPQAFGAFRRFIDRHPDHPLANKAYQSIGDAHLATGQYAQALDAFRMVGTIFDKQSTGGKRITPGQRIHLRVDDADVNVSDQPRPVRVRITTTAGDEEVIEIGPLGLRSPLFMGSIPTQLASPFPSRQIEQAFSDSQALALRKLLTDADASEAAAALAGEQLQSLQRTGPGADPAGYERTRAELSATMARQIALAAEQRRQAVAGVDAGFKAMDDILERIDPGQSIEAIRARRTAGHAGEAGAAAASQPARAAGDDAALAEALSRPLDAGDDGGAGGTADEESSRRGMTQDQTDQMRLDVVDSPTQQANFERRLEGLVLWRVALSRQYQKVEVGGDDTITVEYEDEVGPQGRHARGQVLRRDVLTVATDARIGLFTVDGENPVSQAVLGGAILARIEDADADRTERADTVQAVLCAIERTRPGVVDQELSAPPTTQSRPTPGLISPATAPRTDAEPLVLPEAKNIRITLVETGAHTGIFQARIELEKNAAKVGKDTLPLDPDKRLRLSYADGRGIRHSDGEVLAVAVDCVPSRGGSVAAVEYRQTPLDLQAQLARAVASGEIGKIYLDLGLEASGRRLLQSAQADCQAIAKLASKTPLGESALYHSWRMYFYAGLLDEASAAAGILIRAYPDSEYCDDAMLALGQVSLARGRKANEELPPGEKPRQINKDLHRAITQLESLVSKYPNSPLAPEALFLVAEAQQQGGQSGLEALERLAKTYPDSGFTATALIAASDYYVSIADYPRAQEYLSRVLIDHPDSPRRGDVLLKRGVCQLKLGQSAEAVRSFYQVIEEHPGTESAEQARKLIRQASAKNTEVAP